MADQGEQSMPRYVRSIIAEDAHHYEVEWEPNAETGETYLPSWHAKMWIDRAVVDAWEALKASMQPGPSTREPSEPTAGPVSAEKQEWAAKWIKISNDIFQTTPHKDNPNGSEWMETPITYWETAFDACLQFQGDARRLGFVQGDFPSSGKKLANKDLWEVNFNLNSNPFSAMTTLQIAIELVVVELDKQIHDEENNFEGPLDQGFKLVESRNIAVRNGQWNVDQEYLRMDRAAPTKTAEPRPEDVGRSIEELKRQIYELGRRDVGDGDGNGAGAGNGGGDGDGNAEKKD